MELTKTQKMMATVGMICISAIPIWIYLVVPELEKMPADFYVSGITHMGTMTFFDAGTGEWGTPIAMFSDHVYEVIDTKGDVVIFSALEHCQDPAEEKTNFKNIGTFGIDRSTRKIVPGYGNIPDARGYFDFPLRTEMKDYDIWNNLFEVVYPSSFERKDTVLGLDTYVFNAKLEDVEVKLEQTILGNQEMPVHLPREVFPIYLTIDWTAWVEPVTGNIIDENAHNEIHIIDPGTGEKVPLVMLDHGPIEDTVHSNVDEAQNLKMLMEVYETWTPLLLGVIGVAMLVAVSLRTRLRME